MRITDVYKVAIIKYKEFSFKAVLAMVTNNKELKSYIPDDLFETKRGSRDYIWMILWSFRFEYVTAIHKHAIRQRQIKQGQDRTVATLKVCSEMALLLADFKFIPSKSSGKSAHVSILTDNLI